jgi:hypothetical protein
MKRALLFAALLALSTGCTLSTSTVRVRDTAAVAVESPDGASLLPPGTSSARVAEGSFWVPFVFHPVPYELRGERAEDGAITLRCDACEVPSRTLLGPDGSTLPAYSWRVAIEPAHVAVSYEDECLQSHRQFCDAPAAVRLVVPKDDVVEVRRRVEPIRPIGYLFTGVSALALRSLAFVALRDHDAAPFAAVGAVPFLGFAAFGLWELFAPAKEQVWTP